MKRLTIPGTSMFTFLMLMVMFLSSCNPTTPTPETVAGPSAWIDKPLNNTVLALAPVEILFHAGSNTPITAIVLEINDHVIFEESSGLPAEALVSSSFIWKPDAEGEYLLKARALDSSGVWSENAEALLRIGLDPTRTASPTATSTGTPTTTLTPTPDLNRLLAGLWVDPHQVYNGTCGQNRISFYAQVTTPLEVKYLYLFVRLQDAASGEQTTWNEGFSMNPSNSTDGAYSYTLPVSAIPNNDAFNSALIQYQLVGAAGNGDIIGRSSTFSDIALAKCGFNFPLMLSTPNIPSLLPFPSNTPEVIR